MKDIAKLIATVLLIAPGIIMLYILLTVLGQKLNYKHINTYVMNTLETGYIVVACIAAVFFMVHIHEEVVESNYKDETED